MRHSKLEQKNLLFLSLLAVVLGFLVMLSINTNQAANANAENTNAELIAYIEENELRIAELETEIRNTRDAIAALQSEQVEERTLLAAKNEQLERLNDYAGYTELSGEGLIIVIDDNSVGAELAQKNNPTTYNAEHYLVHDKDLLYLIRALAGHAEAIAVNNIRFANSASIRCVGTVIMVNSSRLAPPYELRVIGDAAALQQALEGSARYAALVYRQIPIKVSVSSEVEVPAYNGVYSTLYSTIASNN
ncbi:MAG: DUF881 domain-containing protein [Bacillota bacterium]|nr:DUF881 domain-containing protein [Bacillota bacterium]